MTPVPSAAMKSSLWLGSPSQLFPWFKVSLINKCDETCNEKGVVSAAELGIALHVLLKKKISRWKKIFQLNVTLCTGLFIFGKLMDKFFVCLVGFCCCCCFVL